VDLTVALGPLTSGELPAAVGAATQPGLAQAVLWVLVGLAAVWDVAQRRVPNPLIVAGLLLGLGFETQSGGFAGLGLSFLGAAVALGLLIVPFAMHKIGGGDVKLAMVCGTFLGWRGAIHVVLIGSVIQGLLALVMMIWAKYAPRFGRQEPDLARLPQAVGYAIAAIAYSIGYARVF
jgi:Flp pilus assembly protein protease CpaA